MLKPKTQADIVSQFLQGERSTNEFDDEICIPGLAKHFESLPSNAEVRTAPVRVPDLKRVSTRSRIEIAEMIIGLLDYNPGVVGFKWIIGQDSLDVKYVEGFEQRTFENEKQREDFLRLITMILKARKNVLEMEWNFGEDHVKVKYLL